MPNRFDFGGVDLTAGENSSTRRPSDETPLCIAILGDFSGRASRALVDAKTIAERRAILVDRDNFDEVLSDLKVELRLPTAERVPVILRFAELEDFHPDRLFENSAFGKLREIRERLQNPSTFAEVAEELGLSQRGKTTTQVEVEPSPAQAPSPVRLASGSLLDDMIEQTEARGTANHPAGKRDDVREFARQLAAKYSVSAPDPRRPELVAMVDEAISDVMRTMLHSPDMQALEALWRATFLLVRQLETGPKLKLYLIDISKAELTADLNSSANIFETGTFRLLVEKGVLTPGADPWSIVIGNYFFGTDRADLELLARIAKLAKRAGCAFLAAADSSLLGTASLVNSPHPRDWQSSGEPAGWAELRRSPEADCVGLVLPRFLLRLPYGEKTSRLESFDFEELPGAPSHEGYLWGNPAFTVALLLAQSFMEEGWEMRPGSVSQIDKLPLHIYQADGDSISKPCAEVLFTEDAVQRIVEEGLIPLVSFKGRDSVRMARLQSIADPPRPLRGRWVS